MKFEKDDYVLGIWFCEKHNFGNVVTFVKKDRNADGKWEGKTRFRYFKNQKSEKIFNSEDEKSAICFEMLENSEEKAIEKMRFLFDRIRSDYNDDFEELLIKGGPDRIIDASRKSSWLHMKRSDDINPWGNKV